MINAQRLINNGNIEDLRNDMYPKTTVEFRGSYDAIVTRCIDKTKRGWIKVSILGLTDDLPLKDQPWAEPAPSPNFQIPDPGTHVIVEFREGDIHYPIWHSASGQAGGKFFNVHDSEIDYPNNHIIYNSNEGTTLKNNRKTGEFTINHSSGTTITLDKSGKVTMSGDGIGKLLGGYKVVTSAAFCPYLSSGGAPVPHPTGSSPMLTIDDTPGI